MRVLTITSRLPRPAHPGAGTLVLDRIRAMREAGAEVRIIQPVPWPGSEPAKTPGIPVRSVRFPRIPGIGTRFEAFSFGRAIRKPLVEEIAGFAPEVIDAHDVYPDGVAVLSAAKKFRIPVAVTAHGRDVKVLARLPAIHERLVDALPTAAAVIAVTPDLAGDLVGQRICRKDVVVIENGVDAGRFRPGSREDARAGLGLPAGAKHLVCAGNLASAAAPMLLLSAMVSGDSLPAFTMHFLGDGPERRRIERLSGAMGQKERVVLHGHLDRDRLALFLAAADGAVALGRGTGAVQAVREALACRIPVLAADIPVMRDLISPFRHGVLVPLDRNGVTRGLRGLLTRDWDLPADDPRTWGQAGEEILARFEKLSGRM